jgi:hypothetical protein
MTNPIAQTKTKISIENWAMVYSMDNPYKAPELQERYLAGTVYGHPNFKDGSFITTSYVVDINDKEVTTASGSLYLLGTPSEDYQRWLREHPQTLAIGPVCHEQS